MVVIVNVDILGCLVFVFIFEFVGVFNYDIISWFVFGSVEFIVDMVVFIFIYEIVG